MGGETVPHLLRSRAEFTDPGSAAWNIVLSQEIAGEREYRLQASVERYIQN